MRTILEQTSNSSEKKVYNDKNPILFDLVGHGCVGQGVLEILEQSNKQTIKNNGVLVRTPEKHTEIKDLLLNHSDDLFLNKNTNTIIELINDSDQAFDIVNNAFSTGKNVISANKKLIAERFKTLFDRHIEQDVAFLYEGAVAGGIPIIRILETYYQDEPISKLQGILNGSSNYIISKMVNEGLDFEPVLKQAQDAGFAEEDPSLDIDGFDAKYKLCILNAHAFGIISEPEDILSLGIRNIDKVDIEFAQSKGLKIKLLGNSYQTKDGITSFVLPTLIDEQSDLYNVENENNAILISGEYSNTQSFSGKGAGSLPTGQAVFSDLISLENGNRYQYNKLAKNLNLGKAYRLLNQDYQLKVYIRYQDKEELKGFDFDTVYETGSVGTFSYIIADATYADLKRVQADKTSLFIAAV